MVSSFRKVTFGEPKRKCRVPAVLAVAARRVQRSSRVSSGVQHRQLPYSELDQVVTNLLENAARHAPQGSTVRVGARSGGAMVELWVADEGIGVATFDRSRIFEPFRRGEGSSSSGVGLAICKAIVEAHGGSIDVLPNPGGGARFRLTVPVRRG
jgi:signal transduction histidine kinase